eukprot:TRINITY_DN12587_c0_g1_i2.p1 TRINITY_DN12587_c0_g1~~TRINITY_DN12587_c0_g1_i2.p1  ORF type:complete len:436 (-),score=83.20 TRINITY_DN12587_c0_g1_i2:46-1353(-)
MSSLNRASILRLARYLVEACTSYDDRYLRNFSREKENVQSHEAIDSLAIISAFGQESTDLDPHGYLKAGCILWDLTSSIETIQLFLDHKFHTALLKIVFIATDDEAYDCPAEYESLRSARMLEISLGILANICIHKEPAVKCIEEGLLVAIHRVLKGTTDSQSLFELMRLIEICLSHGESTMLEFFQNPEILTHIMFIVKNSNRPELREKALLVFVSLLRSPAGLEIYSILSQADAQKLIMDSISTEIKESNEGPLDACLMILENIAYMTEPSPLWSIKGLIKQVKKLVASDLGHMIQKSVISLISILTETSPEDAATDALYESLKPVLPDLVRGLPSPTSNYDNIELIEEYVIHILQVGQRCFSCLGSARDEQSWAKTLKDIDIPHLENVQRALQAARTPSEPQDTYDTRQELSEKLDQFLKELSKQSLPSDSV